MVKNFNNLRFWLADTAEPYKKIADFLQKQNAQKTAFIAKGDKEGEFNIEFYRVLQEVQSEQKIKIRTSTWQWGNLETESEDKMHNIYDLEKDEGDKKSKLQDSMREITGLKKQQGHLKLRLNQINNLEKFQEGEKKKQEIANKKMAEKELKKQAALAESEKLLEQQMQQKKEQEQKAAKNNDTLKNQALNKALNNMKELFPFVVEGCLEKVKIMAAKYTKEDPDQHKIAQYKIALNASENGFEQQAQIKETLEILSIEQIREQYLEVAKGILEWTDPESVLHKSAQHFIEAYDYFYNQENPLNHYNLAKEFIESIFSQHPKNSPDDIHHCTIPVFFHNDFSNRYINTMLCNEKAPEQTTHKNIYRTVEKFIEKKKLNIFQEFTVRVAGKYLYEQNNSFDSAMLWHHLQMKDFLKSFKFTNPKEPNKQDFPKIKKVLSQEYQKITQKYYPFNNSKNIPIVINIEGEKNESFTIRFTDNPIFHSYITKNDFQDNLASLASYLHQLDTEKLQKNFNAAEIAKEEIEYYDKDGFAIDFIAKNQDITDNLTL